jgi:hemerythrin-like domain-containing protein
MRPKAAENRRAFIKWSSVIVGGTIVGSSMRVRAMPIRSVPQEEEEVSPSEDLMREHGLLKRILLIYSEIGERLRTRRDFPTKTLAESVDIIRTFIEDYHEKLEETYLFPRFKKAGKLVGLVEVLATQHHQGRILTDKMRQLATEAVKKSKSDSKKLTRYIDAFIRMYSPHEAREDTVLFPAFRSLVTRTEYDALGEDFERKEHELFGSDGFEMMVDRVAGLEKALGIDDLSAFTPKAG